VNAEISSFADAGDIEKERLVIRILKDLDIGDYVVLCSSLFDGDHVTSGPKKAYWFPDGDVKSGDLVILYTKRGNSATKPLEGGRTAYFYYWRQERPLWDGEHAAVLLEVANWVKRVVPEAPKDDR